MKKVGILVRKEMTEILRDKKTLIIMILMPLLLYPSLIIGMALGINFLTQSQGEKEYTVGYLLENEAYMEPLLALYEEDTGEHMNFRGASAEEEASLREEADVWVSFTPVEQSIQIQVAYTSTDSNSGYAESVMEELVESYRDALLLQNLEKEGLTEDFLTPVTYEAVDSVSVTESLGMNIGNMVSMILIMMILIGAFYPAVDITTGEKERGTLETLLTLPVTNFQMIMSKFIAVSVFACATAILSVLALGGSFVFIMLAMPEGITGILGEIPMEYFLTCIPLLLLALITTALLITAFCMCFCVFAKSSKEANNYITPVMLVIMFASMVGMIPSIELNDKLALIPLINVGLLFKQIFAQHMDLYQAVVTIVINAAYSVITIWVLGKMYNSEDIMFSDDFKSFRLFNKRGDIKKGTVPATGDVIISLVVLLLAMSYIGNIFSARDLFVGTIVTQLMILSVPLLLTWYMKSDKKTLLSLRKPDMQMLPGAILLYIGSYVLMLALSSVLVKIFPESTQSLQLSYDEIMSHSFLLVTIVVAAMPAIGEELLFRGLVFGSLRHRYKTGWAIFVSAFIFAAFHGSFVKLIPTALLGACFAYVVYRGGSIFVSMTLHFLNNFISVVAMQYPQVMTKLFPILMKEELSRAEVVVLLLAGVLCVAAGLWLMDAREKSEKIIRKEKYSVDI